MKTIKAIILILILQVATLNSQDYKQYRVESQQNMSIPFIVLATYFGFGIVYYGQPYCIDGKLNGSEECAFLALGSAAIGSMLNRIDNVIPFEFEFTVDPNMEHWDDAELVMAANFNNFKPHLAIEYAYTNNFYNIQYGLGYGLIRGKFGVEPGMRIGTCGEQISYTGYLKESLQCRDFSIVFYQASRSNSIGDYLELRLGVNYKF